MSSSSASSSSKSVRIHASPEMTLEWLKRCSHIANLNYNNNYNNNNNIIDKYQSDDEKEYNDNMESKSVSNTFEVFPDGEVLFATETETDIDTEIAIAIDNIDPVVPTLISTNETTFIGDFNNNNGNVITDAMNDGLVRTKTNPVFAYHQKNALDRASTVLETYFPYNKNTYNKLWWSQVFVIFFILLQFSLCVAASLLMSSLGVILLPCVTVLSFISIIVLILKWYGASCIKYSSVSQNQISVMSADKYLYNSIWTFVITSLCICPVGIIASLYVVIGLRKDSDSTICFAHQQVFMDEGMQSLLNDTGLPIFALLVASTGIAILISIYVFVIQISFLVYHHKLSCLQMYQDEIIAYLPISTPPLSVLLPESSSLSSNKQKNHHHQNITEKIDTRKEEHETKTKQQKKEELQNNKNNKPTTIQTPQKQNVNSKLCMNIDDNINNSIQNVNKDNKDYTTTSASVAVSSSSSRIPLKMPPPINQISSTIITTKEPTVSKTLSVVETVPSLSNNPKTVLTNGEALRNDPESEIHHSNNNNNNIRVKSPTKHSSSSSYILRYAPRNSKALN